MVGVSIIGQQHFKTAFPLVPLGILVIPATLKITFGCVHWKALCKGITSSKWLQRLFDYLDSRPPATVAAAVRTGK